MVADLLVVGLDLVTGQEVHVGDREMWQWHRKGHNGDQTLVCHQCYDGADLPGGPRLVALVPKGRLYGQRRRHFAHPSGQARRAAGTAGKAPGTPRASSGCAAGRRDGTRWSIVSPLTGPRPRDDSYLVGLSCLSTGS